MRGARCWAAAAALGFVVAAGPAQAQSVLWSGGVSGKATFNAEPGSSNARYGGKSVAVDAAGNVFVAGVVDNDFNDDVLIVKYDGATGAPIWGRHYNGPAGGDDAAMALALDPSGNPVVAGYTGTATSGSDLLVLKYDGATGNLVWSYSHNGSASGNDQGNAIAVNAFGDVFVAGDVRSVGTGFDLAVLKLNGGSGTLAWIQTFDGWTFDEVTYGMTLDGAGNPIAVGGTITTFNGYDALAVKFDGATGARLWNAQFNVANQADYFFDAAADASGNVVAVGRGSNSNLALAAKIDGATGAFLWTSTHFEPGSEFFSVALDAVGNAIAAGMTTGTNGQFYVKKLAQADGSMIWDRTIAGPGNTWEDARRVLVDAAGHAYVTGYWHTGFTVGATREDIYTTKLDGATGTPVWAVTFDDGGAGRDQGRALAFDPSGKLVVAGVGYNGNDQDFVVMKLDPASGSQLWRANEGSFVPTYANLGGSGAESTLALDAAGNAYVAGMTRRAGNTDMFIARLDAATGNVAWKSASRASIFGNEGSAVAVTPSGPVVTGSVFESTTSYDILTVKYDAATGNELWRNRFNSSGAFSDRGVAAAVDAAGDVFVTGPGGATSPDVLVLKLNGATGAILWSRQIDLNGGSLDSPFAIQVDAAGHPVVGGSASGGGFLASSVFAVKLDGGSGTTLWTQVNVGAGLPTQSFGFGGLVLDAAGNAVIGGSAFSVSKAYATKLDGANGAVLFAVTVATPDSQANSVRLDATGRIGLAGRANLNDLFAAMLDGATGAPLWETVYPNAGTDVGYSLAFDGAGNLVAVGLMSNGSNEDIGVVAFDTTGAVLWNVRYAGTKNSTDIGYAAAADASGNILVAGDAREAVFYTSEIHVMKIAGSGPPVATFSAASVSFGTQQIGTTSTPQTVTLTNTGTSALAITSIGTSGDFAYGGCAFPSSLPAGASCTFTITFTPIVAGARTGDIVVSTNASGSPHTISLSGTGLAAVTESVELAPAVIDFGDQLVGHASPVQPVTLRNTGDAVVTLVAVDAYPADFPITNTCPPRLSSQQTCTIYVSFRPSAGGAASGSLIVATLSSTFTVPVRGRGVTEPPPQIAGPTLIDFGPVIQATTGRQPLRLSNAGAGVLFIQSWDVLGDEFSVTGQCPPLPANEACTLEAAFRSATLGTKKGRVDFLSSDARGVFQVELVAESVPLPVPQLAVSPGSIGFGNQMVGTASSEQEAELANVGNGRLALTALRASGDFSVTSLCPAALEPGERCKAKVRFSANGVGVRQGVLSIESNDPRSPHAMSLTGIGCRPYTIAGSRISRLLCGS